MSAQLDGKHTRRMFVDTDNTTDMSLRVIQYCVRYIKGIKTFPEPEIQANINKKQRLATMLANATHQSTAVLFCKLRVPVSVRADSLTFTVYGIITVKTVDTT